MDIFDDFWDDIENEKNDNKDKIVIEPFDVGKVKKKVRIRTLPKTKTTKSLPSPYVEQKKEVTKDLTGDISEVMDNMDKAMELFTEKVAEVFTEKGEQVANGLATIANKDIEARIYLWKMDGWTDKKISDEICNIFSGIDKARSYVLIKRVNASFGVTTMDDLDQLRNMYTDMYSDLYRRAVEKKDYAVAKGILDSLTKLQNLVTKRTETKVENVYKVEF